MKYEEMKRLADNRKEWKIKRKQFKDLRPKKKNKWQCSRYEYNVGTFYQYVKDKQV